MQEFRTPLIHQGVTRGHRYPGVQDRVSSWHSTLRSKIPKHPWWVPQGVLRVPRVSVQQHPWWPPTEIATVWRPLMKNHRHIRHRLNCFVSLSILSLEGYREKRKTTSKMATYRNSYGMMSFDEKPSKYSPYTELYRIFVHLYCLG